MANQVVRAGRDAALPAITVGQQFRFALLVGWTSLMAAIRDPLHRPIGCLGLLLTAATAILGGVVGDFPGALVGAGVAVLGWAAIVMVIALLVETPSVGRADQVWLLRSAAAAGGGHGRACAKVRINEDRTWTLTSVAAWPFNRGLGSAIVEEACSDADQSAAVILLEAANERVGRLYERHNFCRTGLTLLKAQQMRRDIPQQP